MDKREIATIDDIRLLVDTFYTRIREDDMLAIIFNQNIQDRWPEHLDKMYRFWQTLLFEEHTYQGKPFLPHAHLPIHKVHFDRWLSLFYGVLDEFFYGEKAAEAKSRADKMAIMFQCKLDFVRNHPDKPLLF